MQYCIIFFTHLYCVVICSCLRNILYSTSYQTGIGELCIVNLHMMIYSSNYMLLMLSIKEIGELLNYLSLYLVKMFFIFAISILSQNLIFIAHIIFFSETKLTL